MDVIIFLGQSNMQGATGEKDYSPAVNNAYEYKYITNSLEPLVNPVGEDLEKNLLYASADWNGSLLPSFCKEYIKITGKSVVAIHTARGDTSICEWLKGIERFDLVVRKVKAGLAKVKENFGLDKVYVVWLQGESDALKFTSTKDYLKMLISFKNDIKKEIHIDRFGIIRQGYFCKIAPWIDKPIKEKKKSDEKIMKALDLAPKLDNDFYMLTKICKKLSLKAKYTDPNVSAPHYNNKGMEIIGYKAGAKLARLRQKSK